MVAPAVVALSLGLDSARASAALALRPGVAGRTRRYALAFGTCDGLASYVGVLLGGSLVGALEPEIRLVCAALLAAYGVWLLLDPFEWTPSTAIWVPAVLSLDNLGAGVVLAGAGPAWAVAAFLGATSCALAAVGFATAQFVRTRLRISTARVAGVALLVLAATQASALG